MRRTLPGAVYPLYAIVFIDVLGYTLVIPLLAEFGQRFGVSPVVVGSLISTTALCATLSSPVWGHLSDHIGRKRVMLWSQLFTLAGYLLIALAPNVAVLMLSRIVAGLGGGNLGVTQSYIVDVVEQRDRDKALAWGTAAFGLGFVAGPLISGLLVRFGLDTPFWAAAIVEAINILFTVFVLYDARAQHEAEADRRGLIQTLLHAPMLNLMARQLLYIFSFTYFFTAFALYLDRRLHADAATAGLLLGGVAGVVGALTLIVGVEVLAKRFGTLMLTQLAFLVALSAYVFLGFIATLATFVLFLVLWAASGATLRPALNRLIADAAPGRRRGAILGFADSLSNFSMIFAPAVGSAIVGVDPRLAGIVPAACVGVAFALGLFGPHHGKT